MNSIQRNIYGERVGLLDRDQYEESLLRNLLNPSLAQYKFKRVEIPKLPICATAIFCYETGGEIKQSYQINPLQAYAPLTECFFHLLPYGEKTLIIVGCEETQLDNCWPYLVCLQEGDIRVVQKKISDFLICQIENWVCSPSFFKSNIKHREDELSKLYRISVDHPDERRELEVNMFKI